MSLGSSTIIVQATDEFPRHSEGDLVALKDGSLLYAWGRKVGGDDTAQGCIVGTTSRDGGESWDQSAQVIRPVWDGIADVMSVSFCRTSRGLHLFFLGRVANPPSGSLYSGCNRVFQIISKDEGKTWSTPEAITKRFAYNIINNARVIRTSRGRLIAPVASVPGSIFDSYNEQRVHCLYSDDEGHTWTESNELAIIGTGLMEPGIAECGAGAIYMTIRTKTGHLYEARSEDGGTYWRNLRPSPLASAEAPATVVRAPHTGDLWILWCNTPYTGHWYDRNDVALAISKDNGCTWKPPVTLDHGSDHSFGYISAMFHEDALWITYYDWRFERGTGEPKAFHMTHSRLRKIPLTEVA